MWFCLVVLGFLGLFVCFGVFVCLSGLGLGFVAVIAILSEKEVVDALVLSLMEWEGQ